MFGVIKPYCIPNRQLSNGSYVGKETFPRSNLQKFGLLSVETWLYYRLCVLSCEVSCVKREENFTQRFSSHPYQRDAGTVWA
jgi:hypothetical protein